VCLGLRVVMVCCALVVGAAGTAVPVGASGASSRPPITPGVRVGQPYVTPGHGATLGPIGKDPSKAHGIQLSALSGLLDDRPIFNGDFADPFALRDGSVMYAYATDSTGAAGGVPPAHIPVIAMPRDGGFAGRYMGDALPTLPKWTVSGFQWAPAVWARPDGTFVLYYSTPATIPLQCLADHSAPGCVETVNGPNTAMCISAATSTNAAGPFVDHSSSAFVCPTARGGAIDPSVFVMPDGTPWLLWKSDGDCCNEQTHIYSQQLSPDGLSTAGPPHLLIGATQAWEGGLVEAPSMVQQGSTYWLFYSANRWGTPAYGIGVARCAAVTGPCTKPLHGAWDESTNSANGQGFGGSEFFEAGGLIWMVHHGLVPGEEGDFAQRRLYVDLLAFPKDGVPRLAAGAPAAALAEGTLYFGDPHLPVRSRAAFLRLLRTVPPSFTDESDATAVHDGLLACLGLSKRQSAAQIVASLTARGLTVFESYVVSEFAAEYLCTNQLPTALADIRRALVDGS
jgi:hypothetical protein